MAEACKWLQKLEGNPAAAIEPHAPSKPASRIAASRPTPARAEEKAPAWASGLTREISELSEGFKQLSLRLDDVDRRSQSRARRAARGRGSNNSNRVHHSKDHAGGSNNMGRHNNIKALHQVFHLRSSRDNVSVW